MLLAIDTAFAALSVALLDGDDIVAEHHEIVGRGHAETLMTAVAAVVGRRGPDVTAIVVDTGPGSFTGLRVGIAAARALGLAWDVPVTGVGSLALVAAAAFAADPELVAVAVAADAGRGQVYFQQFERLGCTASGPAEARPPASLVLPAGTSVAGSGAALLPGPLARLKFELPRAADIRLLPPAMRAGAAVPLYLRAPDAVAA